MASRFQERFLYGEGLVNPFPVLEGAVYREDVKFLTVFSLEGDGVDAAQIVFIVVDYSWG